MIIKNFIKFIKFHKTYLNVYIKVYNLIYVGVLRPPESNIKTAEITNLNPIHMNNVIYLNTHPILIHILWGTFSNPVLSTELIHTPKATVQLDPPSSDVSLHIAHILFIQICKAINYHKLSGLKTLQWNPNTEIVIQLQGVQWPAWKAYFCYNSLKYDSVDL